MIAEKIIQKFETYVDDGTELSLQDELDLLNKVYQLVCDDRPWLFLRKEYNVFINGTEINLPPDFGNITETEVNGEMKKVVWIEDKAYELINFSDRRNYRARAGYCWINLANNTIEFTEMLFGNLSMDYVFIPEELKINYEPVFPLRFQHALYHLMASDDYIIQQFDKARSYADENRQKAEELLTRMRLWDTNLQV